MRGTQWKTEGCCQTEKSSRHRKCGYKIGTQESCRLIEVEPLLLTSSKQPLPEQVFRRVVGQFQVVHARVDGGEGPVASVHLPHDRQPRVERGEAAGGQGRAPGGKLKEALALPAAQAAEHVDKALEPRAGKEE